MSFDLILKRRIEHQVDLSRTLNGCINMTIRNIELIWIKSIPVPDIPNRTDSVQWTLITTTVFVPKDVAIKMNLLLYRILNEQIDM